MVIHNQIMRCSWPIKSLISLGILLSALHPLNQISNSDWIATCVLLKFIYESDIYWTFVVWCKETFAVHCIEVQCVEAYVDCVIILMSVLGNFYPLSTYSTTIVYI